MIAALYVERGGAYYGLPDVDPWDQERDARKYAGPHPVVAHPPCERWGRYWFGGPSVKVRRNLGDDGGCFAAALAAVRRWGGVLEHPEGSHAWRVFNLNTPPHVGGWIAADFDGGWTCCVDQAQYGHRARKRTWLFYRGESPPPSMKWGRPAGTFMPIEQSFRTREARIAARAAGAKPVKRLPVAELAATPTPFRDLLIQIAKSARKP